MPELLPVLPEPDPMPVLPPAGALGLGVVLGLVVELPLEDGVLLVPPAEELPLALFSSSRHLVRSVPVRPTHLLGVAAGPELALGVDDVPPAAPVEDEPDVCAMETLARANSAAAVAVPIAFIMRCFLLPRVVGTAPHPMQSACLKRKQRAARTTATRCVQQLPGSYFDVPVLPELEPAPVLPELEPMPLLLGLGLVVVLLLDPALLGLLDDGVEEVPPLLLEPDLKYASHSERDTCPSLFLSTAEKSGAEPLAPPEALLLGVEELPPLAALPPAEELPLDMPEEPDEPLELPVALGEDLSLPEAPVEDEPELCAMETLASAKSAAAVAVPTYFSIAWFLQ